MTQITQHTLGCLSHTGLPCDCSQGILPTSFNIRDALFKYINCAFEFEEEFLDTFCNGMKGDDLLECYMASDRCKIIFMIESGTTISNTISTTKFMTWCEGKFASGDIPSL